MKPRCAAGAVGKLSGVFEHDLTLTLGLELSRQLEQFHIPVLLSRKRNDVNISNRERAELANEAEGACFLRLHFNSSPDVNQHGVECYVASPRRTGERLLLQSLDLGITILDHICPATNLSRRWVAVRDDLSGLNWCRIPAVVLELGFLSNEADERVILQPAFNQQAAKSAAAAIQAWLARLT